MVSTAISWYKKLFPAIKKLVKRDDWIFVQDSAPPIQLTLVQDFLEKTLKRFVKCLEWTPSSPYVNPLDYFFWDLVKTKVPYIKAELEGHSVQKN